MRRWLVLGIFPAAALVGLAACGDDAALDAGDVDVDAGVADGATFDSPNTTEDAGVPPDGGPADAGIDTGPLATSYVDFDLNHLLVTGQSNSVANGGTPVMSTEQPFQNKMFDVGVMTGAGCGDGDGCTGYQIPASLVDLVEGDNFFGYPVETPSSSWANQATHLATTRYEFGKREGYPTKHDLLVSVHGRSGNAYFCLRKGGCPSYWAARGYVWPFTEAMNQVTAGKALAQAAGRSYVVRAVATIHGETDHYYDSRPHEDTNGVPNAITTYTQELVEWQKDYEASIKAITGQTQPVPLLVTGLSGWTDTETSQIVLDQLAAHVAAPGKVILVGPTYAIPVNTGDCLHFTAVGQRQLGEYLAKVYAHVVLGGKTWEPVRPKTIARAGAEITVTFHVPSPPLVLDTTRVSLAPDHGFRVLQGGAALAIASVAVSGPDTVKITLAAPPAAGALTVRYGMGLPGGAQTCIGPQNGPRGNVRDSDTTPSRLGFDLFNWAVQFEQPVN